MPHSPILISKHNEFSPVYISKHNELYRMGKIIVYQYSIVFIFQIEPKRKIYNATMCCNKPILHNNTYKDLNPENKIMICKQIFHTCSRFHGLLYFMHLICTLSLMCTSCILRSHPSYFYNIFLLIKKKKSCIPEAKKENFIA